MRYFKTLFLMMVLALAIHIVITDAGDSINKSSGAGDIWWTDVVEIDEAYKNITNRNSIN